MAEDKDVEKTLRSLRKKLADIEELEKKPKGKLNDEQKKKLQRKADITAQIAELKNKAPKKGGKDADAQEPKTNGTHPPAATPPSAPAAAPAEKASPPPAEENPALKERNEKIAALEKDIKKMTKKMKEIKDLKEKSKDESYQLNDEQKKKVKSLKKVKEEIDQLEKAKRELENAPLTTEPEPAKEEKKEEEEVDDGIPKVDKTRLMKMREELAAVEMLKKKIEEKKIKNPTPPQKAKVKQYDILLAAVQAEEARVKEEEEEIMREYGIQPAGSNAEAAEEAPKQTELEKKVAELEAKKQEAADNEDYDLAKKIKRQIEALLTGEDEPEAEEKAKTPAKSPAKSPEAAPMEIEETPEAEPEVEETPAPAEEPAKEEEKEEEPEEEKPKEKKEFKEVDFDSDDPDGMDPFDAEGGFAAADDEEEEKKKEQEKAEKEKKKKKKKDEPKEEAADEEVQEEEPKPEPPKRPKTAEELGIKITLNKKKPQPVVESEEHDFPDPEEDGPTFKELIGKRVEKKRQPYTVEFSSPAEPAQPHTNGGIVEPGPFAKHAIQRLQKDLKDLQREPIFGVSALPLGDDLFNWHVNVAPTSGPFAGYVIPFVMTFSNMYPTEPPVVKCAVTSVTHPCIVASSRSLSEVCLKLTPRDSGRPGSIDGWTPAYTARMVLSHLLHIFHDEVFNQPFEQRGKPQPFKQQLVDLQEYTCEETGHSLATPWPPIPMYNGPFVNRPTDLQLIGCDGVFRCDLEALGDYWVHAYRTSGKHYYRAVLHGEPGAHFGWSTDGELLNLGESAGAWGYNPETGIIYAEGETIETGVKATAGDTIDCFLDLDEKVMSWSVNGTPIEKTVAIEDPDKAYHPSFCMVKGGAAEFTFVTNSKIIPVESLPQPEKHVGDEDGDKLCCFVTKSGSDEELLGIGLTVDRVGRDIRTIDSEFDIISEYSFTNSNVRMTLSGRPTHNFLPLLLDRHHAAKAKGALERALVDLNRDPKASQYYRPPFKPEVGIKIYPFLLDGVVSSCLRTPQIQRYTASRAVQLYSHFVHGFKTLAAAHSGIAADASAVQQSFVSVPDSAYFIDPMCLSLVASSPVSVDELVKLGVTCVVERTPEKVDKRDEMRRLVLHYTLLKMFMDVTADDLDQRCGAATDEQVAEFFKVAEEVNGKTTLSEIASLVGATAEEAQDASEQ